VQEARQLAGPEALLDLLLEPPDEEHLAEEILELLPRERFPFLDFRHVSEFIDGLPYAAAVALLEQWREIQAQLPERWALARLSLTIEDEGDCDRAAFLLGPANPGRRGKQIRFRAGRGGTGPSPHLVQRLLARLDGERIDGKLELLGADEPPATPAPLRPTLAAAWDEELARLPPDWSDLYCEVRLTSTDYLERAALLMAPLNPARYGGETGFRFRVARTFGYGASPEMTRRCFERLDEAGIPGTLRILRMLADTHPNATQGPVWYVGGRSV
jgi:hypothetical protein